MSGDATGFARGAEGGDATDFARGAEGGDATDFARGAEGGDATLRAATWLLLARLFSAALTVSPLWLWLRGSGARGGGDDETLLLDLLPRLGDAAQAAPSALRLALLQTALLWLLSALGHALCDRAALGLLMRQRMSAALPAVLREAPYVLLISTLGSAASALYLWLLLDNLRLRPLTARALALPLTCAALGLVLLLWLLAARDLLLCPAPSLRARKHACLRALHEAPWRLIGSTLLWRALALLLIASATALLTRPVALGPGALLVCYAAAALLHALAALARARRLRFALQTQRAHLNAAIIWTK